MSEHALGPELYEGWHGSELGEITEALEDRLLFRLAGTVAGLRVLEIGCGDGALAVALVKRGATVTALDPSEEMLDAAEARAAHQKCSLRLVQAAGESLPFPDDQFDLVMAKTVLCFADRALDVVYEAARVLRPGGRLVIGELHRWSSWAAQRRIRGWLGDPLWRRGRFRTETELRHLAVTAGLKVETVEGAIYYPRLELAARLMGRFDHQLARLTPCGAAFLAMAARKPDETAPAAG